MKRLIPAILVVLVVLFSFSITIFATKDDPILDIKAVPNGTIVDKLDESVIATVYSATDYTGNGKYLTIGKYDKDVLIDAGVIKDSNEKIDVESLKLNTNNPVVIYLFNSAHFEGHYVEITDNSSMYK